jgi:hypothetical protein
LIGGIVLGAAIAVTLAAYLLLRDGGGDPPNGTTGTDSSTETPGALSGSALPGEGWSSSEIELVSLFDSPDAVFAATPDLAECAPIQAFEAVLVGNEAAFASGMTRQFERAPGDGGVLRVTQTMVTFSDAAAVQAILAEARAALGGAGFAPCVLAAAAAGGIQATAEEGPPLPIPTGGVSRVLRYTASGASGGGTVTQAVGWWGEGEQLVALTVSAAGEAPTDAELEVIARAAAGGDR